MCLYCDDKTVKFESFSENHPCLYIPFVTDLFLRLALSPVLFTDDIAESNRKDLIPHVLLKIIKTILDVCLDIDVALSEEIFVEGIERAKLIGEAEETNIDEIKKYFSIDTYMSPADKETYHQSLRNTVCNNLNDISDLIPCKDYLSLEQVPAGQNLWGPPYWKIIHMTAYKLDNVALLSLDNIDSMASLFGVLDMLLPCSMCAEHYKEVNNSDNRENMLYRSDYARPFPITIPVIFLLQAQKRNMFKMTSQLHKSCKPLGFTDDNDYTEQYAKYMKPVTKEANKKNNNKKK